MKGNSDGHFITGGGHFRTAFLIARAPFIDQTIMLLIRYRITYRHEVSIHCLTCSGVPRLGGPAGTRRAAVYLPVI